MATTLGNLTVTVAGDDDERYLVLAGRLDESVQLSPRARQWVARTVVLDSGGITTINSLGIREWMHFIAHLCEAGAAIVHERCAEVMIEQMCFIPAVRGGGAVRSFHAPYICPACGHEISALLDVTDHGEELRSMIPPDQTCERCHQPMELADAPQRLFAFLIE